VGLVLKRAQPRIVFSVVHAFTSAPQPGFERFILDHEQVVKAVLRFMAKMKALVLHTFPDHKTANEWWGYHTASSIDDTDDAWLNA
jgi:hypothetical protein